jgi:hypothetical protein
MSTRGAGPPDGTKTPPPLFTRDMSTLPPPGCFLLGTKTGIG